MCVKTICCYIIFTLCLLPLESVWNGKIVFSHV